MLNGKKILLGVSGSIACYKAAALASALVKLHANVQVIMTKSAEQFITPFTFGQITGNPVLTHLFSKEHQSSAPHIQAAQNADFVLIAPATANVLAKCAHGIADDILTATILACDCPKAAAPAMNTKMYENPVTQQNLETLRQFGWEIIEPATGRLACGSIGKGKMPEPQQLVEVCLHALSHEKDFCGKRVLVTAGPTCEALDPVRYLTNHSSGKMGYAIANAAARRGAEVTLISGQTALPPPAYVQCISVITAAGMHQAVLQHAENADIIIKAAAVADYRPIYVAEHKMKKQASEFLLPLTRTEDILAELGKHKRKEQFLCGFSMETENLIENSRKKLCEKHLDMIAANALNVEGSGFAVDTNVLTLITANETTPLPLLSKDATAHALLDAIRKQLYLRCIDNGAPLQTSPKGMKYPLESHD